MQPLASLEPELLTRMNEFIAPVLAQIPHRRQRRLGATYARGLLGPAPRKNVEQIARQARGAGSAPAYERDMRAMLSDDDWRHQSLMWDGAHRMLTLTAGWAALTLDDTSLLKQGEHSVGVANQYAGCIGGLANCQALVTLGIAQEHASAPLAMQLFLPESWDKDTARREQCHVPDEIHHVPKWQLARALLAAYEGWDLPKLPVLGDCGYGDVVEFRRWLHEHDWPYVVGVGVKTVVWPAGLTFAPRPSPCGAGRPTTRLQPEEPCKAQQIHAFAKTIAAERWQRVYWRDGSRGPQQARFAAVRVRPARGWRSGGIREDELQSECWLLLHWPEDAAAPTKAWVANLPADTPIEVLISLGRLRWRIERDFREGKGIAGLDHYEGRTWHGLHHHAAFVILAQQFLACERLAGLRATAPSEVVEPPRAAFPP